MQELHSRLKAVARRPAVIAKPVISVADITLDSAARTVTRSGEPISLTRKEFSMLEYLMRHSGVVVSRALLMEYAWSADTDPLSNTIEAHIRNLRKKLNTGGRPNLIANMPGRGYSISIQSHATEI